MGWNGIGWGGLRRSWWIFGTERLVDGKINFGYVFVVKFWGCDQLLFADPKFVVWSSHLTPTPRLLSPLPAVFVEGPCEGLCADHGQA